MQTKQLAIVLVVFVSSLSACFTPNADAQLLRRRCHQQTHTMQETCCIQENVNLCGQCEIVCNGGECYRKPNGAQCTIGCFCPMPASSGTAEDYVPCEKIPPEISVLGAKQEITDVFVSFYDEGILREQIVFKGNSVSKSKIKFKSKIEDGEKKLKITAIFDPDPNSHKDPKEQTPPNGNEKVVARVVMQHDLKHWPYIYKITDQKSTTIEYGHWTFEVKFEE